MRVGFGHLRQFLSVSTVAVLLNFGCGGTGTTNSSDVHDVAPPDDAADAAAPGDGDADSQPQADAQPTACQSKADCADLLATATPCQFVDCQEGQCGLFAKEAGASCDDGDEGTQGDQCDADGLCAGLPPKVVCGDLVCDEGESNADCPVDCPKCLKDEDCAACETCDGGECASAAVCVSGQDRCEEGQHYTCDGCDWVPEEKCVCGCDGLYCAKGQCEPDDTKLGEACGMCGKKAYSCSSECKWVAGDCVDQGECAPDTVVPCGLCGAHKTCSDQCQWLECRGDITVGVAHAVYTGGPADDHDIAAAQTLQSMLAETFGADCVDMESVGSVEAATEFVAAHTATVFLGGQCSWGIGASALNCNGNTFACTNEGMSSNVWGDLLVGACELETIACTDGWLVQKGAAELGCAQTAGSCVFSVMGWDATGTYDASVQFADLLSAHAYAPCSTPALTPDCNVICHLHNVQCGSVDECNCGDCGPCQTCAEGQCLTQEGLGTPCGWDGCNGCVEGVVACVGEQCGLCTQACEAVKGTGCFAGADLICLAAGITGLFTGSACSAVVSTLCDFGVVETTDCHQLCADQGWCPAEQCSL